jgi:hypothetical protein
LGANSRLRRLFDDPGSAAFVGGVSKGRDGHRGLIKIPNVSIKRELRETTTIEENWSATKGKKIDWVVLLTNQAPG